MEENKQWKVRYLGKIKKESLDSTFSVFDTPPVTVNERDYWLVNDAIRMTEQREQKEQKEETYHVEDNRE